MCEKAEGLYGALCKSMIRETKEKEKAGWIAGCARFEMRCFLWVGKLVCKAWQSTKAFVTQSEARQSRKAAFSLAEAMITLLMVSIILAAMAPIMSKKMRLTQTGFGTLGQKKTVTLTKDNCATQPTPEDILKGNASCSGEFEVPDGVTELTVTLVGGGGGGGSALTSGEYEWTTPGDKPFTIPAGINELESTLASGGAGGGAGNVVAEYEEFTNTLVNGTFVLPPGVAGSYIKVSGCGAGGGGGGGGVYDHPAWLGGYGGAGGGSGGSVLNKTMFLPVNLTQGSVTIGQGGRAGTIGYGGAGGHVSSTALTLNTSGGGRGADCSYGGWELINYGGSSSYSYAGGSGQCVAPKTCSLASSGLGGVYPSDVAAKAGNGGNGGRSCSNHDVFPVVSAGGGAAGQPWGWGGGGGAGLQGAGGGGGAATSLVFTNDWNPGANVVREPNLMLSGGGGGGGAGGQMSGGREWGGGGGGGGGGIEGGNGGLGGEMGGITSSCRAYTAGQMGGVGGGPGGGRGSNGSCSGGAGGTSQYSFVGKCSGGAGGTPMTIQSSTAQFGQDGQDGYLRIDYVTVGNGASGGGGGAIVPSQKVKVTPGETLTIIVGAGGIGGTAGSMNASGGIVNPTLGSIAGSSRLLRGGTQILNTNWSAAEPNTPYTGQWGPNFGSPSGMTPFSTGGFGIGGPAKNGYSDNQIIANYRETQSAAKAAGNLAGEQLGPFANGTVGGDGGITAIDGVTINMNGTGTASYSDYSKLPSGWCKVAKGGTSSSRNGQSASGFGGCGGGGGYGLGAGGDGAGGYARIRWNHSKMADNTTGFTVKGAGGGGGAGQSIIKYKITGIPTTPGGKTKLKYTIGLGGIGGTITTASTSGRQGGATTFWNLQAEGGFGGATVDVSQPATITNGKGGAAGTLCKLGATNLSASVCKSGAPGEEGALKTAGIGGQGGFSYLGNGENSGSGGAGANVEVFTQRNINTLPNNPQGSQGQNGKITIEWY